MTSPRPDDPEDILDAAIGQALDEAAWERADMASRRPPELVADLMAARTDDLAASASARDQLRALALRSIADGAEASGPLLDAGPDEAERLALRRRVYATGGLPLHETSALVERLQARYREALGRHASPGVIGARLLADADLHESLWDDPRIPADDALRMVMLCSVAKLRDRADELQRAGRGVRAIVARSPLLGAIIGRRP